MFNFDLTRILLTIPGILIGLAFHEFAHAFASVKLGDPTPKYQGRLTLSPRAHIDPIGFLLIILAGFGWAKPVQVNSRHYRNPRRDEIIVSLAGPMANLMLAVIFSFFTWVFITFFTDNIFALFENRIYSTLYQMFMATIGINIVLFLFNLIPIPPLDGFHILKNFINIRNYSVINALYQYGTFILIFIIVTPISSYLIGKPANAIYRTLIDIFNLGFF